MAPPIRTSHSRWIEEGLQALAAGGPAAVRIEKLAAALGVSRGGFYGHFGNRQGLLDAMLATWERASVDEVLERVEREGGDARARLRRAGALTFSDWLLPIDLAVRDWARRDPDVAKRLTRVDNRRMEYIRDRFRELGFDPEEVEARALLAFSLLIGDHFLAADHGSRSRAEVREAATERLFT
jgi:AcrR family transcriptional regulator